MKRLLSPITAIAVLFCTSLLFSDTYFSVKPSFTPLNGAELGFGNGKTYFTTGIDYLFGRFTYTNRYETYVYGEYDMEVEYEDKLKMSAHVFIPSIGLKHYFKKEKIATYFKTSAFYTLPFFSYTEKSTDPEEEDYKISFDEKKNIRRSATTLGTTFALGSEYFFSDNFSIGGEYGINIYMNRIKMTSSNGLGDELFGLLGLTRSSLVLNYYF